VGRSVDFELTAVSADAVVTQVIDALKTGERTRGGVEVVGILGLTEAGG